MASDSTRDSCLFPRLSENIYLEAISGDGDEQAPPLYFVLDPAVPSWVIVNGDGLELLQLCDGTRTRMEISGILAQRTGNSVERAQELVASFCQQMEQNLIISAAGKGGFRENRFQSLALEITRRCNLRCRHCYLAAGESSGNELNTGEIRGLISAVREAGGVSVAIGGGEPLLRDDCLEIIEHALACGLLVSLGTNATIINRFWAAALARLPIKIQVSLDGASREVHERIRGRGSYDAVVQGIDALVREGKAGDMVIVFTPMRLNLHEVPAIIEFARERKIPVVRFPTLTSSGRAKAAWQDLRLDRDETLRFWRTVKERTEQLRGETDLLADCLSINIHQAGSPYQCSIGTQYRVDPEGDVYPCQCFHNGQEFHLGNVRSSSLLSMITGQKIRDIHQLSRCRPVMIQGCGRCRWQKYCGAGCMGKAFASKGDALSAPSCEVRKGWIESQFSVQFAQARDAGRLDGIDGAST